MYGHTIMRWGQRASVVELVGRSQWNIYSERRGGTGFEVYEGFENRGHFPLCIYPSEFVEGRATGGD